jgi:simple sugar transport system substrate-binding protein
VSHEESVQPPNMDPVHDAIERLEWEDARGEETPHSRLKALTRRTALTGGAAGLATAILTACGGGGDKTT